MACVENIPPGNGDSEMEEGEIVDDLDDLSDISSGEEFLLRQRLQVLENYNNVLERKKAKGSSVWSGKRRQDALLNDLSEISGTDLDETFPHVTSKVNVLYKNLKDHRHLKPHKSKKRKELEQHNLGKNRESKKKSHHRKRLEVKVISESSDESDDEYRNKRRKLANAVKVNRDTNDKSSLQDRLQKMINGAKHLEPLATENKQTETDIQSKAEEIIPHDDISNNISETQDKTLSDDTSKTISETLEKTLYDEIIEIEDTQRICELIDLCTEDDATVYNEQPQDSVDLVPKDTNDEETKKVPEGDSDEDLELLRQHALKTKASKPKPEQTNATTEPENKPLVMSEDEDSDTAELRLICLKSALLKKAIEMKRKQKLQKRLSQSSNLQDELFHEQEEFLKRIDAENNNTDTESVDMDIGSDGDEKCKEMSIENSKTTNADQLFGVQNKSSDRNVSKINAPKEDEFEEDEDLLRARLLTSLSKNLPNLVDPTIIESIDKPQITKENPPKTNNVTQTTNVPEEKRIIINLGESDSEDEEHEATKNLTKMHMKLSEQVDFQQKLDMFLKSTRMEVEKEKLPDVVQKPQMAKTPQKFVAKVVNHLPKSEQIEYKNLVKRMAELEKIKQARQITMDIVNESSVQLKDTLKPRNVTSNPTKMIAINNLDEQIALSRKNIAEESAKMLKLKEEATKLSQKYKIVQTELRNLSTAINLNKKEQRIAQNRLSKIRIQHQRLLNSSSSKHSSINGRLATSHRINPMAMSKTKLQKENNPAKEETINPPVLKSMRISIVNDLKEETTVPNTRLSVQVDVSSNKKTVNMPISSFGSIDEPISTEPDAQNDRVPKESDDSLPVEENVGRNRRSSKDTINSASIERRKEFSDYESPLQALGTAIWDGDPNAILCPFVVGGDCKDPDCQYLHPKVPSKQ